MSFPRSCDFLRGMSLHLAYEIWMFSSLSQDLIDHEAVVKVEELIGTGSVEDVLSIARFESFLLHSRVLLEFLFPRRRKETDIVASYYASEWPPSGIAEVEELNKIRDEINRRLAHLTERRYESRKRWNVEVSWITEVLNTLLGKFFELVPDHLLGKECLTQKKAYVPYSSPSHRASDVDR